MNPTREGLDGLTSIRSTRRARGQSMDDSKGCSRLEQKSWASVVRTDDGHVVGVFMALSIIMALRPIRLTGHGRKLFQSSHSDSSMAKVVASPRRSRVCIKTCT
ncbi:hypothetical protein BDV95DRAFT_671751 [Massariosphaeria phaeospora]|uniref:Uncharacterized protein n=1 Tax=Massariosphaeria phaeospora TaxID=100035 RepID=A0A7C8I8A0_9PLEO|nr:hypothetical protein BDV95DRAFT_671751 [Massariosphaeria phaeospora]